MVMAIAFALGVLVADAGKFDLGYELNVRQAYDQAYRTGAEAMEVLRIVDQDGKPVAEANIRGALQTGGGIRDYTEVMGMTDTNGVYVVKGWCKNFLHCSILKKGYYPTKFDREYYNRRVYPPVMDGKWQPYGTEHELVLKKISCLGILSVPDRSFCRWQIPEFDVWIPFDLEKFDWTYPYGRGVFEDVIIKFGKRVKNKHRDYSYSMDISFANHPYAGAYIKKCDRSSELAIDPIADTNATFVSRYSFSVERKPDGSCFQNELLDDEYLVFRTRTQTNETGRLVSAHYGVLYGGWLSGDKEMRFYDACFNPAPNDNVIDDGMLLRRVVKRYQSQMEGR